MPRRYKKTGKFYFQRYCGNVLPMPVDTFERYASGEYTVAQLWEMYERLQRKRHGDHATDDEMRQSKALLAAWKALTVRVAS